MVKRDYSQFENISIDDLPIKFEECYPYSYDIILSQNQVKNLAQLFEAYDNGAFKDGRKTGYQCLKGTIEILRNVYLDEPLIADSCLEIKKPTLEGKIFENQVWNKLTRLGLTIHELAIFLEYYKEEYENYSEFITIDDIMRDFQDNKEFQTSFLIKNAFNTDAKNFLVITVLQNLIFKLSVLTNYHNKNKDIQQSSDKIIENLKKELISLSNLSNVLDLQIKTLEGQIESLSNSKGMKK